MTWLSEIEEELNCSTLPNYTSKRMARVIRELANLSGAAWRFHEARSPAAKMGATQAIAIAILALSPDAKELIDDSAAKSST